MRHAVQRVQEIGLFDTMGWNVAFKRKGLARDDTMKKNSVRIRNRKTERPKNRGSLIKNLVSG